jgi:hypothetical protein
MSLPQPEYISLQETSEKLQVSLNRTKWLIESGHLPAYARLTDYPEDYSKWHSQFDVSYRVVLIINIIWNAAGKKSNCHIAEFKSFNSVDETKSEFFDDDDIILKVKDIETLIEHKSEVEEEIPVVFDASKHIDLRLSEGMTPAEIAVELVDDYGTQKEKYYGLIARKLYHYPESSSNSTWRKRGEREYKKAKESVRPKNATQSPITHTP